MDIRQIDNIAPELLFDLVKVHASETFCRQAGQTPRLGDAWQSVAAALSRARFEEARDASQKAAAEAASAQEPTDVTVPCQIPEHLHQVTEEDVRRRLVAIYMELEAGFVEAIIAAKIQDELSFFKKIGYRTVEKAWSHWTYYLRCLCCKADEICSPVGNRYSEMAKNEGLVCMPLDSVDLQILASAFQTQITVTHLNQEPWRFKPQPPSQPTVSQGQRGHSIHLVRHGYFWAPLLGPAPPEYQCRSLEGCVVELGNMDSAVLTAANQKTAVVSHYDRDADAWIVIKDQVTFPVERSQINQVLFYEGADKDQNSGLRRTWRSAEALQHIPDGALQFQILMDLVRECGRRKLEEHQSSLAGRANTTRPTEAASASSSRGALHSRRSSGEAVPENLFASSAAVTSQVQQMPSSSTNCHRCLNEVKRELEAGREIRAFAVTPWLPQGDSQMAVRKDDSIVLSAWEREWVVCRSPAVEAPRRWCPMDCFTIWEVKEPFTPPSDWPGLLSLEVGQSLVVTQRFGGEWRDWAQGHLLSSQDGSSQGSTREGLFSFEFVEPKISISS